MLLTLRRAGVILLMLVVICGIIYPAIVTGIAKIYFPSQLEGSLIKDDKGVVLGSELIGQQFTAPQYFWGRLSATGPVPYNAAASSGSNLSNHAPDLTESVKARVAALKAADPTNDAPIPIDLVTASASGLDPHISIAAVMYQINRVALIRGLSTQEIQILVDKYTEDRIIGIFGEPVVNILKLNLALDGKINE